MDRLWAPWRIRYVKAKRSKKCIFCLAVKSGKRHYLIHKTKYTISLLNIFPYNNGHMMICPIRHVKELTQLKTHEILDLIKVLNDSKKLLDKVLKPHGYNIGINVSMSAGAGIVGHLHIHLVPRWKGDTNFMPVLYNAKIISQSLNELYNKLKHAKSKSN